MKEKLVWYVCYGSNLLEERFLCYIRGGRIPGSNKSERGAKDKSLPIASEPYMLKHKLFFGGTVEKWKDSGVAFIEKKASPSVKTYGRKYLITEEQFFDVIRQENNLPQLREIQIDYDELKRSGTNIIFPDSLYGRLVYLGEEKGISLYTFTSVMSREEIGEKPLCGEYYNVIFRGIRETFELLSDEEIKRYLRQYTLD